MNNEIIKDATDFVNNVGVAFDTLTDFTKTLGEGIIDNRRTMMNDREATEMMLEELTDRVNQIDQTLDILVANLAKLLKVSEYEIL